MIEKEVIVASEAGLHARPAARIVELSKGYPGNVYIMDGHKKINCKSMIELMTAQIKNGQKITVQVEGPEESAFIDKITGTISS